MCILQAHSFSAWRLLNLGYFSNYKVFYYYTNNYIETEIYPHYQILCHPLHLGIQSCERNYGTDSISKSVSVRHWDMQGFSMNYTLSDYGIILLFDKCRKWKADMGSDEWEHVSLQLEIQFLVLHRLFIGELTPFTVVALYILHITSYHSFFFLALLQHPVVQNSNMIPWSHICKLTCWLRTWTKKTLLQFAMKHPDVNF